MASQQPPHRHRIALTITDEAKTALDNMLSQSNLSNPIPTLVWSIDPEGKDPGWMIGSYERNNMDESMIVQIDNMEFVIEPQWRDSLENKVLDIERGFFKVIPDEL